MKILILASNPRKDLNLDREIRDLKDVIEKSRDRQEFEVEDALAVRVGDLQDLLFRYRPQVVHFCGHGSGQQGLVFEGNDGGEQWVRAEALSDLFRLFAENVGCVLLNACYSEEQANAIVNHIDYVIGMSREIQDNAAIAFSKGFYRALGYECSIEQAFEFGRNAIQLEISGSSKMRSATTEQQRKLEVVDAVTKIVIPEHLKPILKCRATLTPVSNLVISGSEQMLSQAKREEIQLGVAKALAEEEPSLNQFREQVREYLQDRQLAEYERDLLNALREELGLSTEEADRILEEEQAPIRQAQQAYKKRLVALLKYYPFNETIERELKKFQIQRDLTDEEVEKIAKPILEAAAAKCSTQFAETDSLNSERGVDYTRLRDLLLIGEWKAADQETNKRMCEVMDRQLQGCLRPEDIERFPCADLNTIDHLWTRNSNGKFGFSVQRKIWQECGCPTSLNSDWKEFGNRVGWRLDVAESRIDRSMDDSLRLAKIISNLWREKKRWISYDEIIFDISASLGQLPLTPFVYNFSAVGEDIEGFQALFSRIQTCTFKIQNLGSKAPIQI